MECALVDPWRSPWWGALCECAEKGGATPADIIEKVSLGHAMGWPVETGFLVIERTEDDAVRIWLGVGENVRMWWREAERELTAFAREIGCNRLELDGRKGWRKILPHWAPDGEGRLILPL